MSPCLPTLCPAVRRSILRFLLLPATALLFTSCAVIERRAEEKRHAAERAETLAQHASWREGSAWRSKTYRNEALLARLTPENASLEISLDDQRGLLLVDGLVAMDFPVATGKRSHPTPTGEFKILGKTKEYSSNLYGKIVDASGAVVVADADTRRDVPAEGTSFVGSKMPYWMRLNDSGVGLHVGYVPGRPASHGCIRLKRDTAKFLFETLKVGTPVVVAQKAPTFEPAATRAR